MLAQEHSRRQQPFVFHGGVAASHLEDPYSSQNLNSFSSYDSCAPLAATPFHFYDSVPLSAEVHPETSFAMFPSQSNSTFNPPSPHSELPPTLSTASAASVRSNNSSTAGSPYSSHARALSGQETWGAGVTELNIGPTIVNSDSYDQRFGGVDLDAEMAFNLQGKVAADFVDPSLIQPSTPYAEVSVAFPGQNLYHTNPIFAMNPAGDSPNPSHSDHGSQHYVGTHLGPEVPSSMYYHPYPAGPYMHRRTSITSMNSRHSRHSPMSGSADFDMDNQEKGRCPHPDCGRVFKDLKAHMLTHQPERPEKCPILNCEYNQKGFARKYDKNRHTLTHYKGTMVCGFCPGSGSAAEKSFNRADVFKRHLTSVHGVEQTPPNSRKRSPGGTNKKATVHSQDASGKCSTCTTVFSNAQDFYEHLDDCVLRVVQQEEPSEAINQKNLGGHAADEAVKATTKQSMLTNVTKPPGVPIEEDDEDDVTEEEDTEDDDEADEQEDGPSYSAPSSKGKPRSWRVTPRPKASLDAGKPKPTRTSQTGLTHSRGGVSLLEKNRNKRKALPAAWGLPAEEMTMKKRVMCVFDGPRRLWKDDMMIKSEYDVRMGLADGKSYVTDLDVASVKRAEALHCANPEEKGSWNPNEGVSGFDVEEMMS